MTEERIITAAVVTSEEKGDGPELPLTLRFMVKKTLKIQKCTFTLQQNKNAIQHYAY